jgi:hypothetical protein
MRNWSFLLQNSRKMIDALISQVNFIDLWHKRLRHYHQDKLKLLHESIQISSTSDSSIYGTCQIGKQCRHTFSSSDSRSSQKLELIHSDVVGLMSEPSLSRNTYYLEFINDYSKMCWVYFMRNKSEVIRLFKVFKAFVENQSRMQIKALRSDNYGKYTST